MKDYIELLIAFVLGFFMKHLLGTVCQSRLIEGHIPPNPLVSAHDLQDGEKCVYDRNCKSGDCDRPNGFGTYGTC